MKTFGLIGYPLGHSFSKELFNQKFSNEHIDAVYQNFPITRIGDLIPLIKRTPDLSGLNVTIPYKTDVIPFLDELDDSAKDIQAVNVIRILKSEKSIKLIGYNSDVYGFVESIKPILIPADKNALILGSGGASKAVEYGLNKLNIHSEIVSRTPKNNQISYSEISKKIGQCSIIVNTTPLGMYPNTHEFPPIPFHLLTSKHCLFDLIYNPEETIFLKNGKEMNCRTKNGKEMLLLQAKKAWEIWNL